MSVINRDIAIIGGGSSGPSLLIYLAENAKEQSASLNGISLHLIDSKGFAYGGIAYGDCHPNHRLNSTRDEMSPWEPDEFHQWCVEQGLGSDIQSFNFRADYGRYLKQRVQQAIAILKSHGAEIYEHQANVFIKANNDAFDIIDENGNILIPNISGSDITLSVGYGENNNFQNLNEFAQQGYIHSPYDHEAIAKIKAGSRVSFIGAGPALYDFTNSLPLDPDQIKLNVFSKTGEILATRLTQREPAETSIVPKYFTAANQDILTFQNLETAILNDFTAAERNGDRTPRRVALDVMKTIRGFLETQPIELAQEFRKSALRGALCHAATPVPFESQARLHSYSPQIIQAKLNGNIEPNSNNGFNIHLNGGCVVETDYIINGTGHGRHNSAILEQLKSDNLAVIDERFNILATDNTGYVLIGSGINCIGPSVHFGIDGIESFAPSAQAIAINWIETMPKISKSSKGLQQVCTA